MEKHYCFHTNLVHAANAMAAIYKRLGVEIEKSYIYENGSFGAHFYAESWKVLLCEFVLFVKGFIKKRDYDEILFYVTI